MRDRFFGVHALEDPAQGFFAHLDYYVKLTERRSGHGILLVS